MSQFLDEGLSTRVFWRSRAAPTRPKSEKPRKSREEKRSKRPKRPQQERKEKYRKRQCRGNHEQHHQLSKLSATHDVQHQRSGEKFHGGASRQAPIPHADRNVRSRSCRNYAEPRGSGICRPKHSRSSQSIGSSLEFRNLKPKSPPTGGFIIEVRRQDKMRPARGSRTRPGASIRDRDALHAAAPLFTTVQKRSIRRSRSACCARAASGHAAAAPSSVMNARLFTRSPRRRGRAGSAGFPGREPSRS